MKIIAIATCLALIVAMGAESLQTLNLNMSGKRIVNLRLPTSENEAATRGYVDGKIITARLSAGSWTASSGRLKARLQ